jgi:hypothetical protein
MSKDCFEDLSEWYRNKYKIMLNKKLNLSDPNYKIKLKEIEEKYNEELIPYLTNLVDGYQNQNLTDAVKSQCEIMFDCDEYYLFEYKHLNLIKKCLNIKFIIPIFVN